MNNERELLAKAQALDEQALEKVYDQHSPELFRFAYRLLGNVDHAEECVAETFSRLLRAISNGKGPTENLRAYLYKIADNWTKDFYRKANRVDERDMTTISLQDPTVIEDDIIQDWEYNDVVFALHQLTDDQKWVIVLHFLEGWKHEEIANLMDKPITAVRSLQRRGLERIRDTMVRKGNAR